MYNSPTDSHYCRIFFLLIVPSLRPLCLVSLVAEPLKYLYNEQLIEHLSQVLNEYTEFDSGSFKTAVFDSDWDIKELKDRMRHITVCMGRFLPKDYPAAIEILKPASARFPQGFEYMIFPDFVEVYGFDHWEVSMSALEQFTQYSSSEFAIRHFLIQDPEKGMKQMMRWSNHENFHVRRLASEGCRPRLPWAVALPEFKKDPSMVLEVLENLKADSELYVRKSVANNLNDISKDHPDLALQTAQRWIGDNSDTNWIVKHAMRGLLKQGLPEALQLFGFGDPEHIRVDNLAIAREKFEIGDTMNFKFNVSLKTPSKVRLEYVIHYMKANGKNSPKVFQISEKELKAGDHQHTTKQSLANMSTRKHYPGRHELEVRVNGVVKARTEFTLE